MSKQKESHWVIVLVVVATLAIALIIDALGLYTPRMKSSKQKMCIVTRTCMSGTTPFPCNFEEPCKEKK